MALRKVDGEGHQLEQGAADAYAAMLAQARLDGVTAPSLTILSAHRTTEQQTDLWKGALAKYGDAATARKWVAPPGRSDHEKGIAVDLSGPSGTTLLSKEDEGWKWMQARAADFGFRPYDPEPWHWAYKGSWSASWASIPSLWKWATGGAIALWTLWPADDGPEAI